MSSKWPDPSKRTKLPYPKPQDRGKHNPVFFAWVARQGATLRSHGIKTTWLEGGDKDKDVKEDDIFRAWEFIYDTLEDEWITHLQTVKEGDLRELWQKINAKFLQDTRTCKELGQKGCQAILHARKESGTVS